MHDTKLHTDESNQITGRLEGWHADIAYNIVWGYLYDDAKNRWWDGAHIHTSSLLSHSRKTIVNLKEGDIIKTLNSTYLLGKPFVRS